MMYGMEIMMERQSVKDGWVDGRKIDHPPLTSAIFKR